MAGPEWPSGFRRRNSDISEATSVAEIQAFHHSFGSMRVLYDYVHGYQDFQ